MSEIFYLVTIEVGRTPRTFTRYLELPANLVDAQDRYHQIMNDVYAMIGREYGISDLYEVDQEVCGAVLFYHVEPWELTR